ncbi:MAG: ydjZ 4 [Planctomycetaceae bacterium]|nr:ydjZ 4 [Planctomycetaceae bacterium]
MENIRPRRFRWAIGLASAALLIGALFILRRLGYFEKLGNDLLDVLINQLTALRELQATYPVAAFFVGMAVYAVVTGLSFPGAALMTIAYGWLFGFWQGLLLVSFASVAGATLAFLLSRYLLRDRIQRRFGDQLQGFQSTLQREGPFYLFTLRLIPVVPFFVINVVFGLTPISVRTFWWVSQLGMLPGTAVYVYAGTSLPGLEQLRDPTVSKIISPQLLVAFALLGIFPLLVKKGLSRITLRRE